MSEIIDGYYGAAQKVVNISAVTAFPAMVLQYIGDEPYAKVAVDAATGDVTVTADAVDGATTAYATFDVSGAALNTFGELADAINAKSDLRCYLVGARRAQSCDNILDTLAATSIATTNGLTLYFDEEGTGNVTGFAITNEKFVSRPTTGFAGKKIGWQSRNNENVINTLNYMELTLTDGAGGVTYIYSINDKNDTVATLYSDAYATATKEVKGDTPRPNDIWIAGNLHNRLVVQFDAGAALTAAVVNAFGSSRHIFNGDVQGANYTGCI